jgi:RimJ/RimL family protein N-acetyltransferase
MMYRYLFGEDRVVAQFVAQLIPHVRQFGDDARTIGVLREDGVLIAGLVYTNYDQDFGIIEMHGASIDPHWLTRSTIERMYRYQFVQVGVQMLVQRTPVENERLLRQLAAYDYHFIKIPRMFGRGKDGVLCCLTYEAWIGNRFKKRFKHHLDDAPIEEAA